MVAYTIWLVSILHAFNAWRLHRALHGALMLAIAVTLQATLGILTLLYSAPLHLAMTHQILAVVILTAAVIHAERLSRR
jgi:cytochrome c oxidase assembly protein subunit 15